MPTQDERIFFYAIALLPPGMAENKSRVIRASEIGEYVYCHRAWWLGHVAGAENANRTELDAGTERHRAHGQRVRAAAWLQRAALVLFALAVLLALALLATAH